MHLETVLRQRFGHPAFRPGQEEIVQHVADGEDALVVMPTGAGKSICYQMPALARGGTTLVVSPLLALMKDQVEALQQKNVRATFINSSISPDERRSRIQRLKQGEYELLYVAPERFNPRFLEDLKHTDVRLIAVDEAHCLSQWGHDFRPDYLRLGRVRAALPGVPTVALTATATPKVQDDIVNVLGINDCRRFIRGFDRTNLVLDVIEAPSTKAKLQMTAELLGAGPTIIYCATRKNVERVVWGLRDRGVQAGMYHAGMEHHERIQAQETFMSGREQVVVATNAFGMGVDKDNIRTIVHYELPGTIEAYYQEIGRAGRDGKTSRVVLLFREGDRRTQEFFIRMSHPPASWVRALYQRLLDERENPVWLSLDTMAAALPEDGDNPRTAASCLAVLQREGFVRRIAPSERPAEITRLKQSSTPKGTVRQAVLTWIDHQVKEGESLTFRADYAANQIGLERMQISAALRGLEDRGFIRYRPPERTGGIELLKPNEPLTLDEPAMEAKRQREFGKLEKMVRYAYAPCRRRYLLEYFGQTPPWERCGTCDACREGRPLTQSLSPLQQDEDLVVRKLLSAVARMKKPFSAGMIAKVATGSKDKNVLAFGFQRLSTYGILSTWSSRELESVLQALATAGALETQHTTRRVGGNDRTYKELSLTDLGRDVMMSRAPDFKMTFPKSRRGGKGRPQAPPQNVDTDLLSNLRDVRTRLARAHDVPAYVIAPNRTLEQMAAARPVTKDTMLAVHGMGKERFRRYGPAFLDAVRTWAE